MMRGVPVAAVAGVVLMAGACHSSSRSSSHYTDVHDLISDVSGFLDCQLSPPLPAGAPTFGPEQGTDLSCFDRNGGVVLGQWFRNHADLVRTARCCYSKVRGSIVSGDNWVFVAPVAADRRDLLAHIGGHAGPVR